MLVLTSMAIFGCIIMREIAENSYLGPRLFSAKVPYELKTCLMSIPMLSADGAGFSWATTRCLQSTGFTDAGTSGLHQSRWTSGTLFFSYVQFYCSFYRFWIEMCLHNEWFLKEISFLVVWAASASCLHARIPTSKSTKTILYSLNQ